MRVAQEIYKSVDLERIGETPDPWVNVLLIEE